MARFSRYMISRLEIRAASRPPHRGALRQDATRWLLPPLILAGATCQAQPISDTPLAHIDEVAIHSEDFTRHIVTECGATMYSRTTRQSRELLVWGEEVKGLMIILHWWPHFATMRWWQRSCDALPFRRRVEALKHNGPSLSVVVAYRYNRRVMRYVRWWRAHYYAFGALLNSRLMRLYYLIMNYLGFVVSRALFSDMHLAPFKGYAWWGVTSAFSW